MPRVSIVVPAYDEAESIEPILRRLDVVLDDAEVIVVDDGSTDGTAGIAEGLSGELGFELRVIVLPQNQGKGAAVRRGITASRGDVVGIQDADLEYDPADLPVLLAPILAGTADVVYGTRMRGNGVRQMHKFTNLVANRFLSILTDLLYNTTVTDMETGYKVFRGDLVRSFHLTSDDFRIEPELTARVLRHPEELAFLEIPISYFARTEKQGKKIGWRDGLKAIVALFVFRMR